MLKKRLVGVVTVKNGWAVQSFGYKRYLPLGKPECLIENLDRWGADEILVQVIDRSQNNLGPDFELLERIGRLGLETPLIYSGGIRDAEDGVRAIQSGADRLVIESILHDDIDSAQSLSARLGAQAVIAAFSASWISEKLEWLDYRCGKWGPISENVLSLLEIGIFSEALVIDCVHEGYPESFDARLVSEFPIKHIPLIAFGGVSHSTQMTELLQSPSVSAVAVGNFLNYREHAVQKYKESLAGLSLRSANYESTAFN